MAGSLGKSVCFFSYIFIFLLNTRIEESINLLKVTVYLSCPRKKKVKQRRRHLKLTSFDILFQAAKYTEQ
jgi:hypothetical protein